MGGGDHHRRGIVQQAGEVVGHRRRAKPQVVHVGTGIRDAERQRLEERGGARPGVASDEHPIRAQQPGQFAPDPVDGLRVEVLPPDAPDVVCLECAHLTALTPLDSLRSARLIGQTPGPFLNRPTRILTPPGD